MNYLACQTRPDIAHAVNQLARDLVTPTEASIVAAKRVLRYLAGTRSLGLTYGGGESAIKIEAFSDSDWAGDVESARSTSGLLVKFGGAAVIWGSRRQPIVALSSSEAEYIALSDLVREIVWLKNLLDAASTLKVCPTVVVHVDNQTAIKMATEDSYSGRRKHINVKYHWIREHVQNGTVRIVWIETSKQQADVFTKALGPDQFKKLRDSVLGND